MTRAVTWAWYDVMFLISRTLIPFREHEKISGLGKPFLKQHTTFLDPQSSTQSSRGFGGYEGLRGSWLPMRCFAFCSFEVVLLLRVKLVPCCSPVCCSCARPHHVALWRTQSSSQSAAQTRHMPLCPRLGAAATGRHHLPLQAALGHQTGLTCCLSLLHQATLLQDATVVGHESAVMPCLSLIPAQTSRPIGWPCEPCRKLQHNRPLAPPQVEPASALMFLSFFSQLANMPMCCNEMYSLLRGHQDNLWLNDLFNGLYFRQN